MTFSKFFIDRPIFATVASLIVLLSGLLVVRRLPIEQFPDVVPPTATVSCSYDGADAETVANAVAIPIETEVNGVDNMIYMSSTCSNDGNYELTVYFKAESDPDMNAVNVTNRVSAATPRLPEEIERSGVTVQKKIDERFGLLQLPTLGKSRGVSRPNAPIEFRRN